MYQRKIPEDLDCGLVIANRAFAGKWKPCIIDSIARGVHRPGEIQRAIPTAPARVIKMQLRELELSGIVFKRIHAQLPLRVEYFLTDAGRSALPIIAMMEEWGLKNREVGVVESAIVTQVPISGALQCAPVHP